MYHEGCGIASEGDRNHWSAREWGKGVAHWSGKGGRGATGRRLLGRQDAAANTGPAGSNSDSDADEAVRLRQQAGYDERRGFSSRHSSLAIPHWQSRMSGSIDYSIISITLLCVCAVFDQTFVVI